MTMRTIRLELARTPDHPDGAADMGYELHAPLTGDGHLDQAAWRAHADACRVRRFWRGADDEHGRLVIINGNWAFQYAGMAEADVEPIFKLGAHRMVVGEYLSITEHDGVQRTFKVVSLT